MSGESLEYSLKQEVPAFAGKCCHQLLMSSPNIWVAEFQVAKLSGPYGALQANLPHTGEGKAQLIYKN